MTPPTQSQINEIFAEANSFGIPTDEEGFMERLIKLSWQKSQDEVLKDEIKFLDKVVMDMVSQENINHEVDKEGYCFADCKRCQIENRIIELRKQLQSPQPQEKTNGN